jgi:hypothetical protein
MKTIDMMDGPRPDLRNAVRDLTELCRTDDDTRHVVMSAAIHMVGWAEAARPGPPLEAFEAAVRTVAARQGIAGHA